MQGAARRDPLTRPWGRPSYEEVSRNGRPMDFGLRFPSTHFALAALAAMLAGDVLGLWVTGIRLDGTSVETWVRGAVAVGAIFAVCGAATWRLRGDTARGAVLVKALAERICLFSAAALLIGAITTAGAVFSYMAAAATLPLRDGLFVAMDRSVGFDWLAVTRRVCDTPWLEASLAFAYRSSMLQVALLVPILVLTGQRRRLSEFVALFAVTGAVICVVSGLVPAEGPLFHFSPSVICRHVTIDGALDYHADLMALRAGGIGTIVFSKVTGIVTFPSFHTALAISVIYAAWRTPFIAWPVAALNAMVIAATMPLGGHYLVDVGGRRGHCRRRHRAPAPGQHGCLLARRAGIGPAGRSPGSANRRLTAQTIPGSRDGLAKAALRC